MVGITRRPMAYSCLLHISVPSKAGSAICCCFPWPLVDSIGARLKATAFRRWSARKHRSLLRTPPNYWENHMRDKRHRKSVEHVFLAVVIQIIPRNRPRGSWTSGENTSRGFFQGFYVFLFPTGSHGFPWLK